MLNRFTFTKNSRIHVLACVILLIRFAASSVPIRTHCVFKAQSPLEDNILFPAADPCCADHSCNGPSNCDATPFSVFLRKVSTGLQLLHIIPDKDVICGFIRSIESNI